VGICYNTLEVIGDSEEKPKRWWLYDIKQWSGEYLYAMMATDKSYWRRHTEEWSSAVAKNVEKVQRQ